MIVNLRIFLIEMLVFAAIFTAIIFAYYRGDRKYNFLDWVLFPGIIFALIPAVLVGCLVTLIR